MKKCVLYDERICNNCGECMLCDLDPEKICDSCGKCLAPADGSEFLSMIVHAGVEEADDALLDEADNENLSDEEKQLLAFLDAPPDLQMPEPLSIDRELYEKWERILAGYDEKTGGRDIRVDKPRASYGIRARRKK